MSNPHRGLPQSPHRAAKADVTASGPCPPIRLPEAVGRPAKRSFSIRGHRTSVSLEWPFWDAFVAIAATRGEPVARLAAKIDEVRGSAGLSSAIRVFVLEHHRRLPPRGPD